MLASLGVENYKAFPKAHLDIRPITVLLGVNSVGKSSLINLLLGVQQTNLYASSNYPSALKLNEKMTSLGEVNTLFPNGEMGFPIKLSFELMDSPFEAYLSNRIQADFDLMLNDLRRQMYVVLDLGKRINSNQNVDTQRAQPTTGRSLLESVMRLWKEIKSDRQLEEFFSSAQITQFSLSRKRRRNAGFTEPDLAHSFTLVESIKALAGKGLPKLEIALVPTDKATALRIREFTLSRAGEVIISIRYKASSSEEIEDFSSDFFEKGQLHNYQASIVKLLQPDRTIFHFADEREKEPSQIYFTQLCREIIDNSLSALKRSFAESALVHIGPLRASPRRFYFMDRANTELTPGISFVEVLREDPAILDQVNEWLRHFAVKVRISHLADVLQRLHVNEDGLSIDLDITDVGFGISQVLPVIVKGFLAPPGSLSLVEQPEVHLHPKMQADLADLFIQMSGLDRTVAPFMAPKHFIIETHSEYLLKRLRRRIAEKRIAAEDVAIYFLSRSKSGRTELSRIEIDSTGDFPWPLEFYESDLDDVLAYLGAATDGVNG